VCLEQLISVYQGAYLLLQPKVVVEDSGQKLNVRMETSDKWCPSGVRTGTGTV